MLNNEPISKFLDWYKTAARFLPLKKLACRIFPPAALHQPDAMTLATATPDGKPSARMVLYKGIKDEKFLFYTNYQSRKGLELEKNPHVALVFHWGYPDRQIRIEGTVEKISYIESQAYFSSRDRGSQIGAYASDQSRVIPSRDYLEKRTEDFEQKFSQQSIPCPPHWGGYAVKPERIEFWEGKVSRLHDRILYIRDGEKWTSERLAP